MRDLERMLARVARKVARKVAQGETQPIVVEPENLVEMLGPERFFLEQARVILEPGVATGLAWTEAGGDVLYVEASLLPGARGPAPHRPARRRDARVGAGGPDLRLVARRKAGRESRRGSVRPGCTSTCRPARSPRTAPRPA